MSLNKHSIVNRFSFLLVGFLIIVFLLAACQKDSNSKVQEIVKKYYGSASMQPGGTVFIAQAGKTIEAYSFGQANLEEEIPNSSDREYRMASVSKHFTAFSIYQLIEAGKLDLDTKITSILDSMNTAYKEITVGELLNHTSGIPDYEDLIPTDQEKQLSDADVFDLVKGENTTYFEPGTQFRYSNTGFCLLTLLVEQVTGLSYSDYMHRRVFESEDIMARIYEAENPPTNRAFGYHPAQQGEFRFADQSLTSATKGDGGVYISPNEFSKWGKLLMSKINKKDSYAAVLQKNRFPVTGEVSYSMGWFITEDQNDNLILMHSGETTGFHNMVVLDPENEKSITLFTNRDDLLIGPVFEEILKNSGRAWPSFNPSLFKFLSRVYDHRE